MLISEILYASAECHPNREAIVAGDRRITYDKLLSMSQLLAHELQQQGLAAGDHAAVMLPRSIEYVVSYFAILLCGGVVVPIGVELRPAELYADLHYCDVTMVITTNRWSDNIIQAFQKGSLSPLKHIFFLDCDEETIHPLRQMFPCSVHDYTFQEMKTCSFKAVRRQEDDAGILLHTSGTTSRPKRVMLTHRNVVSNVCSHISSLNLTSEDNVLIVLPMHFGYCNTAQMLTHLYLGGCLVLMTGQFHPLAFCALVQQERITTCTMVPTMLLMMLNHRLSNHYDISSLRYVCFGGGPMPVDKLKQLIERFPSIGFVQTYGQTEASPRITCLLPIDSLDKLGSIGKPIPGVQVALLNEQGEQVGPGEVGEIVVNGPNVMRGYYKRPEESCQVLRPEGLFTGDLAYMDAEGYLYLVGRRKNMMISGGVNIYPEEIEECLLEHPAVREVIVIGEAHEMLGEIPVALVVCHPEITITEDALLKHCSERLANHKQPRRIEFRTELAKTYNAKIRRGGQH